MYLIGTPRLHRDNKSCFSSSPPLFYQAHDILNHSVANGKNPTKEALKEHAHWNQRYVQHWWGYNQLELAPANQLSLEGHL